MSISRLFRQFLRSRDGATAIEYGLIAALIGVSIIVGAGSVGNSIGELFNGVGNELDNAIK